MSVVLPAIKGRMGSTDFYETMMTARELARTVRTAKELDRWASLTIEERMQREPNLTRIKKEIAPYLAAHPDRFFGSVIVLVPKGSIAFESLEEMNAGRAYKAVSRRMGFLTLEEGEHIALDGPSTGLLAFQEVIASSANLGPYQQQVVDDEVCVLIMEHESEEKTRRIFSKVNRHAKKTSEADNIIVNADDGYAILTRRLLHPGEPFAERQIGAEMYQPVEWQKSTLSQNSRKLTTVKAPLRDGHRHHRSARHRGERAVGEAHPGRSSQGRP